MAGTRSPGLDVLSACRHALAGHEAEAGPRGPGLRRRHRAAVGRRERADDIAIVVSELVTNALRHALPAGEPGPRRPVRLGLLQPGPCVLCAVADPGRTVPVAAETDVLAETGRGLHVVSALADLWGYTTPSDKGKAVWAMFSAHRGREPGPG